MTNGLYPALSNSPVKMDLDNNDDDDDDDDGHSTKEWGLRWSNPS